MQTSLSIIGSGHVAKTLGRLWHRQHIITLRDILSRSSGNVAAACAFIGAGRPLTDYAQLDKADIYLIATPDDQIAACCERLAATGLLGPDTVVFHCSGSLPASVLDAAVKCAARVASVHPICSFALPEKAAQSFAGTWCGVEGDPSALAVLAPLFTGIGAQLVEINPAAKNVYHAAAVFASNYLVTVLDVAMQAYCHAGIPEDTALKIMQPLVRKTVDQVFAAGTAQALSGPIARGDIGTVERQYQAVTAWDKDNGALYRWLAQKTLLLAQRRRRENR
jgi:predicted short-subunit dehydrogenase-like oxidoreductase (DUF2520 family)